MPLWLRKRRASYEGASEAATDADLAAEVQRRARGGSGSAAIAKQLGVRREKVEKLKGD